MCFPETFNFALTFQMLRWTRIGINDAKACPSVRYLRVLFVTHCPLQQTLHFNCRPSACSTQMEWWRYSIVSNKDYPFAIFLALQTCHWVGQIKCIQSPQNGTHLKLHLISHCARQFPTFLVCLYGLKVLCFSQLTFLTRLLAGGNICWRKADAQKHTEIHNVMVGTLHICSLQII